MNEQLHELSLLIRTNTILIIESGFTKKVRCSYVCIVFVYVHRFKWKSCSLLPDLDRRHNFLHVSVTVTFSSLGPIVILLLLGLLLH